MTRRPHKRPAPRQVSPLTGAAPPKPSEEAAPATAIEAELAALDEGTAAKEGPAEQPGDDTGAGTGEPSTDARAVKATLVDAPAREKTLNELNIEARSVDREHAARREEAERLAREASGHLLEGTIRGRARYRRAQKPVRPPVTE